MTPQLSARLDEILERSRSIGFLGPGPLYTHLRNALGFSEAVPQKSSVLDLGAGGGVPGLPLLVDRGDLSVTLVDASRRRTEFLEDATERLARVDPSIEERVRVVRGRAEELASCVEYRGCFDAVVSRSFGPPAVTAECARPFLRTGGVLVVSEPPDLSAVTDERWPDGPLSELGMRFDRAYRCQGSGYAVLEALGECPVLLPRRTGVAARRPIY